MQQEFLQIPLDSLEDGLILTIYPEGNADFREIDILEAEEFSESQYQILEGNSYEYHFNKEDFQLAASIAGIVIPSKRHPSSGRIVPNIYVGTLMLDILNTAENIVLSNLEVEVLATKFNKKLDRSYRENYRFMLEDITDKCTELLMQINSPVHQTFEIDFNSNHNTVYQRFCFVQSILNNSDFVEAIHKVISNPKTNWNEENEITDIRKIRRFSNNNLRQIISGTNRIALPENHLLRKSNIHSVPLRINGYRKIENVDTPENRFIKYVLEIFKKFCEECLGLFEARQIAKPIQEAKHLIHSLESQLNHPFFQHINPPTSLKLNSPVLQKRSGYREILNRWLQFDLASKLIWKGGEDVYKAGKKDIASLYEYWLFFTLYDLVKEKFNIQSVNFDEQAYNHLIVPTNDGLNVMVKAGIHNALEGIYTRRNRDLQIKFSYNRTFKGGNEYSDAKSGSWTASLRPDYTLSVWSNSFTEEQAEANESIVHIHFDAKYKITNFYQRIHLDLEGAKLEEKLNQEELDERKGTYKNVDLLKMHAYKDAIRRSGGAYILYPGAKEKPFRGFHEIIPGLGAFSVNPSTNRSEINELSKFIDSIIDHLLDRTSQRENVNYKSHQIYQNPKDDSNILHEFLPEYISGKKLIPDEIYVLVGYSTSSDRFKWYEENKKYIFRMDGDAGSLELNNDVVNAQYLLLRRKGETYAFDLYQIKSKGPKVFSSKYLDTINYPPSKKPKEYYLAIEIEKVSDKEFENVSWDFKELEEYKRIQVNVKNPYSKVGLPFTVLLSNLMKIKTK